MNATDFDRPGRRFVSTVPALAPEIDLPVYLLQAEQMSGGAAERTYIACTGALYSRLLRGFIPDFRGDGIVIVYSAQGILDAARHHEWIASVHRIDQDEFIGQVFAAVLCHELAHAIADDFAGTMASDLPRLYTPKMIGEDRRNLSQKFTAAPVQADHDVMVASLRGHHRPAWVRVALHLAHRWFTLTGAELHPKLVFDAPSFGMATDASMFKLAFSQEFERWRDRPFAEIIDAPMPREFARLWESELTRLKNQPLPVSDPVADATVALPADGNEGAFLESVSMSTLTTFFGSVADLFRQRDIAIADSFAQLVRDTAAGKSVKPENAAAVLRDAGRTPSDLQAAVELILRRRQLRKTFDGANGTPPRRAKIAEQSAEIEAKFERARQEHEARAWELIAEEREIDAIDKAAADARAKLEASANEATKAALRDAEQVAGKLNGESWEARRQLAEAKEIQSRLAAMVQEAGKRYAVGNVTGPADEWQRIGFPSLEQFNEAAAKVRAANADVSQLTATVETLTSELAAADKAIDAARLALLEP